MNGCENETVTRQLSVSSDSKLLDEPCTPEDQNEEDEPQVILRQNKRPPRPKSEVFLTSDQRKSKRYSAFGVSSLCFPEILNDFYSLFHHFSLESKTYRDFIKVLSQSQSVNRL